MAAPQENPGHPPGSDRAPESVRAHVTIVGRVQGVYFRAQTRSQALALGLTGWVRNHGEDVEAVFEGTRETVALMTEWCHEGPPRAAVEHVELVWEEPEGLTGFEIRPSRS